jgi:starch synthase
LNGIDVALWDPRRDALLPERYSPQKMEGKRACKAQMLREFGLFSDEALDKPAFTLVGRLAAQKGIDLVLKALPRVLDEGMTFFALGVGQPELEAGMRALAAAHPKNVAVRVGFDERLAHLLEAGGDFFLMPSLYEPCGLNQMYSLRYGTVPIVRATGGLDDTVVDASLPKGNGIKFAEYSAEALEASIRRALALYPDRPRLDALRRRGMQGNFSWAKASGAYERLYRRLADEAR